MKPDTTKNWSSAKKNQKSSLQEKADFFRNDSKMDDKFFHMESFQKEEEKPAVSVKVQLTAEGSNMNTLRQKESPKKSPVNGSPKRGAWCDSGESEEHSYP